MRDSWLSCISKYCSLMLMVRKKDAFIDDKIKAFQDLTDHFCEEWIKLNGREGIPNYIHMLGARYIA